MGNEGAWLCANTWLQKQPASHSLPTLSIDEQAQDGENWMQLSLVMNWLINLNVNVKVN